jgi:beta-N-acetylhexosaminidase
VTKILKAAALLAVALLTAASAGAPTVDAHAAAAPALDQLIGQKLVVSMNGTTPTVSLLARARRGKIGGVIIHSTNFSSAARLRSITTKLQQAAAGGGHAPLLIAVDQEGGPVKTISWIPPTVSPRRMGELDSTTVAHRQGKRTGAALLDLGVNFDLAPVADVPTSKASFMYLQGRTWAFGAAKTARLSSAFAAGLADAGALASMKHFPGLGFAVRNTDTNVVRISATEAQLAPGLKPYRKAIAGHIPLVMLSNAVYDAYDRGHAAGWSRPIGNGLLRNQLGFAGVTITDSLDGAAHARGIPTDPLAIRAAKAGTDLLLVTGSEAGSRSVYRSLLAAATDGTIPIDRLVESYNRIAALKGTL